MNQPNNIMEALEELLKAHGLNDEKLSYLTDIPKRFITALRTGDFSRLPANPYVRGYLIKIAGVLKIDPDELINTYKESVLQKRSSRFDKLPANRFKLMPIDKKWLIGASAVILIGVFIFFRIDSILGIPELNVFVPEETSIESLMIVGSVKSRDTLTINGEIVYTDDAGNFRHNVLLEPGLNTFHFRVKRFLGRETKVIKTVYYEPAVSNINPVEL